MKLMTQEAPYPYILETLVKNLKYKPNWTLTLEHIDRGQGSKGLTLCIYINEPNAYQQDQRVRVVHYMIVPAASFDEQSWRRWLIEQLMLVEKHEAAEFFELYGEKVYAPNHGPGRDPYILFDYATDEQRRTKFTGEINEL
jgi:hypothetical protein